MRDQKREILNLVAAGTITAEEGAARLEALESTPTSTATSEPTAPPQAASPTRHIKVTARFGSTEIVGDPSVTAAVADGPHRAHQEGDTMVIEQSPFDEDASFAFGRGDRRIVVNGIDFHARKLTVRMNPDLALEATVQAGNLRIHGVHGPITTEVQAGNCNVADFRGAINLDVAAGNVSATGKLDRGASKVRCEMGSVKISLDKGSSVRIMARTTMGKIAIEGEGTKRSILGNDGKDFTIGSGTATLDIECTMGNVKVAAD
jgi:hypothetical protein